MFGGLARWVDVDWWTVWMVLDCLVAARRAVALSRAGNLGVVMIRRVSLKLFVACLVPSPLGDALRWGVGTLPLRLPDVQRLLGLVVLVRGGCRGAGCYQSFHGVGRSLIRGNVDLRGPLPVVRPGNGNAVWRMARSVPCVVGTCAPPLDPLLIPSRCWR